MTRPRKQPIELTASAEEVEELTERVSRRRLLQLAGAGGAAFVAGCGGGGEATPTATEAPAQETATEGGDTATETGTMETPAGQEIELVDATFRKLTQGNFEQFTPQPWNAENAFQSAFQSIGMMEIPKNLSVPSPDLTTTVILQGVARQVEFDPANNKMSVELQSDPPVTFADGTVNNVDHVFAHWDLVKGRIEMGEAAENRLPLNWEATGEFSFEATLLPGNAQIRLFESIFSGSLTSIDQTHPKLHSEWIESVRDATTSSELRSVYQELQSATFPKSKLPDISNGGYKPTNWDPQKIEYEAREEFPWGLGFNDDLDRVFGNLTVTNVGAAQARRQRSANIINATINNKQDHFTFTIPRTRQRFPDEWEFWTSGTAQGWAIWYQPHEPFGAKTEQSRKLRKAITSLFDNSEVAAIEDLVPGYEQSMGFWREVDYKNWLGDVEDQYEDFGDRDSGYVKEQKGKQYFRDAGYQKNKDGFWVDQESGEVLSADVILGLGMGGLQLTQPILRNVPEQLNGMGVKATGKMVGGEEYSQAVSNAEGDIITAGGNCEMHPHPYFGYREDCGLGSSEGLPVSLWFGDFHNEYRRVEVPMPVGDVDGELKTYDWDKNVLGIAQLSNEEIPPRIQELSWVLNQWNPGIFAIQYTVELALNTDRIKTLAPFSDPTASEPIDPGVERPAKLWEPGGVLPRDTALLLTLGLIGPA